MFFKFASCIFCNEALTATRFYTNHYNCDKCECYMFFLRPMQVGFCYYDNCFLSATEIKKKNKKQKGFLVKFFPETKEIKFYKSRCELQDCQFTLLNIIAPFYSIKFNADYTDIKIDMLKKTITRVIKNYHVF